MRTEKKENSVISTIRFIGTLAISAVLLAYITINIVAPNLTVGIFGFQPYNVVTESMEPEIMVNDVVVVGKFDFESAQVGDIITFEADIDYNGTNEVITHYIYSIDTSKETPVIRTHRHYEDPSKVVPDTWLISPDDVLGSYQFHVKYLGYLLGFIRSIWGIGVILFNIAIFFVIKWINRRGERKDLESDIKEQARQEILEEMKRAAAEELRKEMQQEMVQATE
jgi:signal peptidase